MAKSKKITPAEALQDLQGRKHMVQQSTAAGMVKKFKSAKTKLAKTVKAAGSEMPEFPNFLTYNKKAITKLLSKKECVGLRIYPALRDDNNVTLVMVGVDESGNNILEPEQAVAVKTAKKGAGAAFASATATDNPTGTLDEGQASPPYPEPGNGL